MSKPRRKRWLWYWSDEYGPWFGVVLALTRSEAERLARQKLADTLDSKGGNTGPADGDTVHVQECKGDITMATGYL